MSSGARSTGLVTLVLASQATFLGMLGLCVAISPAMVSHRDEGGISNFGVHAATVVPYSAAFLGSAVLLVAAGTRTPTRDATERRFRAALRTLAVLLVAVLVSTYGYKRSATLHGVHIAVAVLATVVEMLLGVWLVVALERDGVSVVACAAQLAGFALAACALLTSLHLLFVAQLVTSAAFAVLLVRGAAAVAAREVPVRSPTG